MTIAIDLIGSVIIAGYIIVIGLRLNFTLVSATDTSTTNLGVQESMVSALESIESDFRKMGFNLVDPKASIAVADTNRLVFRADMDRDGDVDSVTWYVSDPQPKYLPRDVRILYRRINNGTPAIIAHGVTTFNLKYLNQDGVATAVLSQIWIIETTIAVSSPYKVGDQIDPMKQNYSSAFWRQTRLSSRNIKRHG